MKKIILPLCLLLSAAATAQVTYTDINPDAVIAATTQSQSVQYDLDLNNDGTIDFNIKHNDYGGFKQAEFYTNFGQTGEILSNGSGGALALNLNANINSTLTNWVCTATSSGNSALFMNANGAAFPGQQDKFVGLRIKLSGQWHYGWVRLNIPSDTASIVIKDYAYNTMANASVTAGQVATAINSSIEKEKISVSVYPNPAAKTIAISLNQTDGKPTELSVISLLGRQVLWQQLTGLTTSCDISNLPAGIYFIRLIKNKELIGEKKIIIEAQN